MVVIAIIGITASLAISSWNTNVKKAYYSEIVNATSPYKQGVLMCYQSLNTLRGCTNNTNYVPANQTRAIGAIRRIRTNNGVITVIPVAAHGVLTTDRYVLTPRIQNNTLIWTSSGQAVTKGYAK